jgi:hypothetical protein
MLGNKTHEMGFRLGRSVPTAKTFLQIYRKHVTVTLAVTKSFVTAEFVVNRSLRRNGLRLAGLPSRKRPTFGTKFAFISGSALPCSDVATETR